MKKTVLFTLFILPLLTCRNPAALLDKLEDDVKSANGLYLEILDISPSENGQYINPGEDIRIEFDRAIDLDSIQDALTIIDSDDIVFGTDSDRKSISFSFDERSNILTIKANPYLDGLKQYTVRIQAGIKGTDGSSLRESKEWSFSTSDAPRGYVEFTEDYTNDSTPVINIYSQGATYYTIATAEGDIDWATDAQLTGNPTVVEDLDLGADGTKSVYVQFRDGFNGQAGIANLSEIEADSVVLDTVDPTVVLPSLVYGNATTPSPALSADTLSDDRSGIGSYAWSGTGLTFGTGSSATSTVIAAADKDYTVTLLVTDRAGNIASDTMTFTLDTEAPDLPVFSSNPDNTLSGDTTPTLSFTDSADIASYYYREGNETPGGVVSWGSWQSFSPASGSSSYTVDFGTTAVQIRGIDAAGNYSSSQQFSYRSYTKSGSISPGHGDYISGDLVWYYDASVDHYKAYVGTSPKKSGNPEIKLYVGRFEIERTYPFVDISELSLSPLSTYYWYVQACNASGTVIAESDLYRFQTPYRFW